MNPFAVEVALHWVAVAGYATGSIVVATALVFERPAKLRLGWWLALGGLLIHASALGLRWGAGDHGPYMSRHEVLSANALFLAAGLLFFVRKRPEWAALPVLVLPISCLLMGGGLFTATQMNELPPSLRSVWLVFHVLGADLAGAAFILSVVTALAILRRRRGPGGRLLARLPATEILEAYTVRFAGFGFVYWTASVAAGAIWAHQAWGRYWGWDPIETWSLVTWLCYGTFLHLQRFFRLSGSATAWAALSCFIVAMATFFVLPLVLAGLHGSYFQ